VAIQLDAVLHRARKRRRIVALAGLGVAVAAAVAIVLASRSGEPAAAPAADDVATYTIARRDLVASETVTGTLGFESSKTSVVSRLPGAITELPDSGSVIPIGAVLYRVAGDPVVLMRGGLASYRDLEEGVSDGGDVRQLEQNLRALGFDPYRQMRVDDHFDFATRAIVERWQRRIGVDATGKVEAGRVVFAEGPARVGTVTASVGSQGGEVMTISGTQPTVTVKLDTGLQTLVAVGDEVSVDLPDGRTVTGRITEVGRAAVADENASSGATIDVSIALGNTARTESLDQAPVSVNIVKERRAHVLAVPVTALLARAGGGYAVETARRDGTHEQVPVEVGLFASGYVEVSGAGVRPGTKVVVPSL
jgi:peptidoglycan hydrolase-like protein with peptidoglycan-binding domain